jgi:hypothetical protein
VLAVIVPDVDLALLDVIANGSITQPRRRAKPVSLNPFAKGVPQRFRDFH